MSALTELRARVEAATGADRAIDGELAMLAGWTFDIVNNWTMPDGHWDEFLRPDAYTASLDAAVGLVEKMLPGWHFGLRSHSSDEGDGFCAWLTSPDHRIEEWTAGDRTTVDHISGLRTTGDAPTPALALCAALLKALEGREP